MNEAEQILAENPLAPEFFQLLRIDFDYRLGLLFPLQMGLFELIPLVVDRTRKLAKLLTSHANVSFHTFGILIGC